MTVIFTADTLSSCSTYHAKFEQAEIMNFLDNNPSENRMEFTKLQVACKYASIERVRVYS